MPRALLQQAGCYNKLSVRGRQVFELCPPLGALHLALPLKSERRLYNLAFLTRLGVHKPAYKARRVRKIVASAFKLAANASWLKVCVC